jgi:hypothetical protein
MKYHSIVKRRTPLVSLFLLITLCLPATASLIGDEVTLNTPFGGNDVIVDGGFEFRTFLANGSGFTSAGDYDFNVDFFVDIGAEQVTMGFIQTSHGIVPPSAGAVGVTGDLALSIFDLDWVDMPDGIVTGFEYAGQISPSGSWAQNPFTWEVDFGTDWVGFAFGGFNFEIAEFDGVLLSVTFDIITDHGDDAPPIPEPASMTLLGLGLSALALRARCRKV